MHFGGFQLFDANEPATMRGRHTGPQKTGPSSPPPPQNSAEPLGACAMTAKFLNNKICTFQFLLSLRFPQKQAFLDDFPLCPRAPPPPLQSENFIFIVVSPSLNLWGSAGGFCGRVCIVDNLLRSPHTEPQRFCRTLAAKPSCSDRSIRPESSGGTDLWKSFKNLCP